MTEERSQAVTTTSHPAASEIRVVACKRAPEPYTMPATKEWEALFTFVLSPAPDEAWRKFAHIGFRMKLDHEHP